MMRFHISVVSAVLLAATVASIRSTADLEATLEANAPSCSEEVANQLPKVQWKKFVSKWFDGSASKVDVFPGPEEADKTKHLKFGDLVPAASLAVVRKYERIRLSKIGRQADDSDSEKDDGSLVRGICDASMWSLKYFAHNPVFLQELKRQSSAACATSNLFDMAGQTRAGLENMCFGKCMATLQNKFTDHELTCDTDLNTEFYKGVIDADDQCAALPWDSLEWAVRHVLSTRCQTFHQPSLLTMVTDKAPGSLEMLGDDPVCQLPEGENNTRFQHEYIQAGQCPEGSKCKCPKAEVLSRESAKSMRFKHEGQALHAAVGSAAMPSIAKQYATGFVIASAVATATAEAGVGLTAAVVATVEAPMFLVTGSIVLGIKNLVAHAKFHCSQTLGCWPQTPDNHMNLGREKCRLPAKAEKGGSPVWFMPPPMMRIKRSKKFWCELGVCELADMFAQKIGASEDGRDIFNCQPLIWEEMSNAQRREFVVRLRSSGAGLAGEYDLAGVEAQIQLEAGAFPVNAPS